MNNKQLFDLVAPIAIYGGTDVLFQEKAIQAWRLIRKMDPETWSKFNLYPPLDCTIRGNFDEIYHQFALPAYNALFEAIVEEFGPAELECGYDYWGAKGYRLPHQSSRNFELAGDACGRYPWYETADLLIERLGEIQHAMMPRKPSRTKMAW